VLLFSLYILHFLFDFCKLFLLFFSVSFLFL